MATAGLCMGCLGTRECWVCLGRGDYGPAPRPTRCHRCQGTGRCELCALPGELDAIAIDPVRPNKHVG